MDIWLRHIVDRGVVLHSHGSLGFDKYTPSYLLLSNPRNLYIHRIYNYLQKEYT